VVRRDSAGDIFARELVADALRNKADVNAAITAKVTQSENILVDGTDFRTGNTGAVADTVAVRDESGNITANTFLGVATRASTIAVGNEYRGANVNSSANTVAVRDENQDIFAREFVGDLNGNANSASKWLTPRTLSFQGDVSGSGVLDGSTDLTITLTNNADSIALGTDTTGNFVESIREVTNEAYLNVFINGVQDGTPRENAVVTLGISASPTAQGGVLAARDGNGDLFAVNFRGQHIGDVTGNVTGNLTGDVTGDTAGTHTGPVIGDITGNIVGDVTGNLVGDHGGDVYDYIGQGAFKVVDSDAREFKGTADRAVVANNIRTVSVSDAGGWYLTMVENDNGSGQDQAPRTAPNIFVEPDTATLHANIFDGITANIDTINVTTLNYVGSAAGIIPLDVGGLGVDASDTSGKATARSNLDIDSSGEVDQKITDAINGVNQTIAGISTSEIKNINSPSAPTKVTTEAAQVTVLVDSNGHSTFTSAGINLFQGTFNGTATQAQFADLAEKYTTREEFSVGTIMAVCEHPDHEMDIANPEDVVIGVISLNPAFLMNSELDGQAIALKGRVPVRVMDPVVKGQTVYLQQNGIASVNGQGDMIGVALETNNEVGEKLVECVLKV